ncbi:Panacea domain-containing protein [Clostridium oceanicum]|uniref:DUF4065 domain-containing protein n=1 Tax=Clostridium oceanicum TaxID=1543 RepID=A0ABP3UFP8_9CLOT
MCYEAIDIAQYVINYSIDRGKPISNLKLQKVLYYIQAAFLVNRNNPCFKEDIQNWRHGPVVPEVYKRYKIYSNREINEKQTGHSELALDEDSNLYTKIVEFREDKICEKDKILIKKVVDSYLDVEPWEMVKKTHHEDPWIYTSRAEQISIESIREYFKLNRSRIFCGGN